jgi:heptosyltransferase-2
MENTAIQPRRILVRGVNWLGDAVMTTPALLRLRERFPGAHTVLLSPEKLRDLWLHHPAIDEVFTFAPGEGLLSISKRLRRGVFEDGFQTEIITRGTGISPDDRLTRITNNPTYQPFDLALVLPNSPRSALEVFLARIPQRLGYARPWRNFFLTQTIAPRPGAVKMRKRSASEIKQLVAAGQPGQPSAPAPGAHQVYEYLHLAAALGANATPVPPLLFVTHEEIAATRKKFGLENISGPVFGLNAGAEYGPAKRWPVDKFIAVAQDLQKRTNCVWLLFGGKNDESTAAQIQSAVGSRPAVFNLAGQTTLRELMALMKICNVVLTNDTGPMHVAAALGTPVVAPFGSTSPELTGPGLPGDPRHRLLKSDAPCSPCFLRTCPIDFRCMQGITPTRVVESALLAIR